MYYLDETDLCTRLDEAHYRVLYTPRAPIRHFAVPSAHGQPGKRHRYPVARSDAYFVLRHAPGSRARRTWLAVRTHPVKHFVREGRSLLQRGELTRTGLVKFRLECWRGLVAGVWAGLAQRPVLPLAGGDGRGPWRPFADTRRVLVFDPGPSELPDEAASRTLREVADAFTSGHGGRTIAVASSRLTLQGAGPWCAVPPEAQDEEGQAEDLSAHWQTAPHLDVLAGQARSHLATLRALGVRPRVDEVVWPGSAASALCLSVALGSSLTGMNGCSGDRAFVIGGAAPSRPCDSPAGGPVSTLDLSLAALCAVLEAPATDLGATCLGPREVLTAAAFERIVWSLRHHRPGVALTLASAVRAQATITPAQGVALDYYTAHALRLLGRGREAATHYEAIRRAADGCAQPAFLAGACYHLALGAMARGEEGAALQLLLECVGHEPAHQAARRLLDALAA